MMRAVVLLLLLLTQAVAGEAWTIQLAEVDPVVRPGLVWRCRVVGEVPPARFADGPYLAQISLTQGGTTLAAQEFTLTHLGQLRTGIDVVLVPESGPDAAQQVTLAVTVGDRARRDLQHLDRQVPTPLGLQRRLEAQQRRLFESATTDPLPYLWIEQAAELVLDGASLATCRQLDDIANRLDRWLAGERTPEVLRALRDPSDGSVQPYRLHLPMSVPPTRLAVLLVEPTRAVRKCAWPTVPEAWLSAARAAGYALVEVYPAGDVTWSGIARRRVWSTIDALIAAEPRLAALPIALIGSGRAAEAAIALAEDQPLRVQAIGLHMARLSVTPSLPAEPHARWQALHAAGERPANLLATTVVLAQGDDRALQTLGQRLTLAGHAALTTDTAIEQAEFWHALATPAPAGRREWVVLRPQRLGRLQIEELTTWGIAASIIDDAGTLRTTGIARLRADQPFPTLVDGQPYRAPAADDATPRKRLGQTTGPLAAYAQGPFTVVVGTGESVAAAAENRALADAFAVAWAAHAHARVPLVEDTGLDETALPGRHLVLIGNPRSNRLLTRLTERTTLPVQWDARSLTFAGQTVLRAERRAFALAWPHPANDGRLLVILDGRPAWSADTLPLLGLPDVIVGGTAQGDPPLVQHTFDNAWR